MRSCVLEDLPSCATDIASNHIIAEPPSATFLYRLRVISEGLPSRVESEPSIGAEPNLFCNVIFLILSLFARIDVSFANGIYTPSSLHLAFTSSSVL